MAFGFIDFAKEVLEASDRPLSVAEMWEVGCKQGFDERPASSGKTPVRTLSARFHERDLLYVKHFLQKMESYRCKNLCGI